MNQKGISSIVIILIIAGVLAIGGGVWYWQSQKEKPAACTQDAKLCPDGSYVSRTGSNCEFAACPEVKDETANWKTYRNEKYGFEFKYPAEASLNVPPVNPSTLFHGEIEFKNQGSFYNRAVINFTIYGKGIFKQYPESNRCAIYKHESRVFGGIIADVVEQENCPGSEGSPTGGSGHTLTAIFPLSSSFELVYAANLNNDFILNNKLGDLILSTFKFTK